jgi:hypothetical protein
MLYRTISLFDLQQQKIGKDEIMKVLSDFSCPLNKEVEHFMHNKAYDFERVGLARTYLIYAYPNEDELPVLVAIYSLGQSHVEINDDLNKNMKRKIFGTTYPMGKNIKTLLIGQLSKNYTNDNNQYITGDILMGLIFQRIKEIHTLFPSVVIHIDCEDKKELKKFYERYGFQLFKKQNDMLIYLMATNKIIESEKVKVNV